MTMSKVGPWIAELKHDTLRLKEFLDVGLHTQGNPTEDKLNTAFKSSLTANENPNGMLDVVLDGQAHHITK